MATKRKFEIGDAVMVKKTGDCGMITGYSTPWYYVDGYTKYTANQLKKAGDENFTYGDRVRVIEDTGTLEAGEVGTIIAKDADGAYLFESGTGSKGKHRGHDYGLEWGRCGKIGESRCGWVVPSEVEKIKEEPEKAKEEEKEVKDKFKMGDRVVCKTKDAYGFELGETGTIVAKRSRHENYYLVRHDNPNHLCHNGNMGVYDWGEHSDENDCTYEYGKDFKLLKETPKKDKFKIGDRVVCKKEGTFGFSVGETGTVIAKVLGYDDYYLIRHDVPNQWCHTGAFANYVWGKPSRNADCTNELEDKFELIENYDKKEEIHITRKGREVHAILKKDGKMAKRTVAKCHPDDEFDFETGAKLAMNRLYGTEEYETIKEKTEMKPSKYRVGDMVLLKTKEELIKEFGGMLEVHPVCIGDMEAELGKVITLERPKRYNYDVETFRLPNTGGCVISDQYIKGKIVKCDEYKVGDKVLVKSEKQVSSEKLFDVSPHFVEAMRKYCDKVITLGTKTPDETFLFEGFWWGKDFFVGKVVE